MWVRRRVGGRLANGPFGALGVVGSKDAGVVAQGSASGCRKGLAVGPLIVDIPTGSHTAAAASAAANRDPASAQPASVAVDGEAPLEPLRRVALRATLGGRVTLGALAARALEADAARLRSAQLPTAADLLDRLAQAGMETRRTVTGERIPAPPDRLARAWTAAMVYQAAATRSLLRTSWET
jgi:hypothetical protein